MKNLNQFSKKLVMFFLVFLLLSSESFSDVTLTDEEYQTIKTELEKSKVELVNLKKEKSNLETALKNSENLITMLLTVPNVLTSISLELNQGLTTHLEYLKKREKDQWIRDLEFFGVGVLTAFSIFSAVYMMRN